MSFCVVTYILHHTITPHHQISQMRTMINHLQIHTYILLIWKWIKKCLMIFLNVQLLRHPKCAYEKIVKWCIQSQHSNTITPHQRKTNLKWTRQCTNFFYSNDQQYTIRINTIRANYHNQRHRSYHSSTHIFAIDICPMLQ